jgi:hypothetical protein
MKFIGIATIALLWLALALGPTVGVVWLIVHFARKFW